MLQLIHVVHDVKRLPKWESLVQQVVLLQITVIVSGLIIVGNSSLGSERIGMQ